VCHESHSSERRQRVSARSRWQAHVDRWLRSAENAVDGLVADGRTHIVLNLSRLLYIDSGGLGEMLACHLTASKAGGAVTLAQTTARIQELLAITGLVTVFDTYETEQLALDSFASPAASGAMSRA
jgi:anti-sigma B factor antagonist